jgi:hypothetical protein
MPRPSPRNQGLFPCEAEVARRLSQSPTEWAAKAKILERDGLPKVDPLMGGRPWPAVQAYFLRRYGPPPSSQWRPTEWRTSMPSEFPTPGLKRKARKSGPDVPMWAARADLVKRGYEPKTVRLPYRLDEPEDAPLLSAACLRLQAEMLEWSSGHLRDPNRFDSSIRSLSRRYQTDPESPFDRRLEHTTREKDAHVLGLIERTVGDRLVPCVKLADLWRWYDAAKKPKAPGRPERIRRAWGLMKKLRELFSYGVAADLMTAPGSGISSPTSASRSRLGAAPLSTSTMSGPSSRRRSRWGASPWRSRPRSSSMPSCGRRMWWASGSRSRRGKRGPASCSTAGAE